MATVTEMADRVCQVAGLASTGAERAIVVSALNQANGYAGMEVGNNVASFTAALTADDGDYTLSASPFSLTAVLELRQLYTSVSSTTARLLHVSETKMTELRRGGASSGTPQVYALRGTVEILFWPLPSSGVTVLGSYLKEPLVLLEATPVAGTSETTPSWIPKALHYEVVVNGALSIVMEKENRFEEAQMYRSAYQLGIERAAMWHSRFGGPTIDDEVFDGWGFEPDRDV